MPYILILIFKILVGISILLVWGFEPWITKTKEGYYILWYTYKGKRDFKVFMI